MMKAHAAAELLPPMSEGELADLIEDIRSNGQLIPIVAYEGQILDGRNRWLACEHLGITPKVAQYDGDDPVSYVISANVKRRHLTQTQKAEVARKALPLYEQAARERQRTAGQEYGRNHPKKLPPSMEEAISNKGEAIAQAAKAADVSASYVASAKRLATQAPDLHARVLAGEFSIAKGEQLLQQRLREQGKETVTRKGGTKRKQNRHVLQGAKSEAAIAQIEADAERQNRAAVIYDVVERLGRCPYDPADVAAAVPPEQRFRVDTYLKAASDWLEEFRSTWTSNANDPA